MNSHRRRSISPFVFIDKNLRSPYYISLFGKNNKFYGFPKFLSGQPPVPAEMPEKMIGQGQKTGECGVFIRQKDLNQILKGPSVHDKFPKPGKILDPVHLLEGQIRSFQDLIGRFGVINHPVRPCMVVYGGSRQAL